MGCVRRSSISLVLCLCAVCGACVGQPLPAKQASEIYARATNQFSAALFFKPAQATNSDLACQLAPLIIQEAAHGQAADASSCDQFGTLHVSHGFASIDPSRPAVCWTADSVQLNGRLHARFLYQWWYPPRKPPGQPPALPRQGIRITLDTRGQPAVWEVLADISGLRLVFISQGLEAASAAQFGEPLPGRRHSIERSLKQAPSVVVARTIDDGPQAMGPIAYLSKGTRNVSTLICRCMPAQVKSLRTKATYELLPLSAIPGDMSLLRRGLWPSDAPSGKRLEARLRLADF